MAKRKSDSPVWDISPRKTAAHAKLKNLPEEDQETLWLLMHPADPAEEPQTYEQVLGHLLNEHDITCSISTLSEWHSWYALNLRMDRADERALQARIRLARDPDISEEELDRICARIFKAEAMEKRDGKAWATVKKVEQLDRKLEQADKKLKQDDTKLTHDDRRIFLLEEAAANAKAKLLAITKQAKSKGGITPETLAEIEAAAGLL